MKVKTGCAVLALFLLVSFAAAPGSCESAELFINTDPIGAEVTIGDVKAGTTPLRIPNYEGGALDLRIVKSGYVPLSVRENLGEERRKIVFFTLSAVDLRLSLDQKGFDVYINDRKAGRTPLSIDNLPAGSYELEKSDKGISISNTSYRSLKRTTWFETAFSGGLAGLSLAGNLYYDNKGQGDEARALGISTVIFGSILAYNLLKLAKINTNYRKAVKKLGTIEVESLDKKGPQDYFSSGMEFVGRESWEEALLNFLRVANLFPDSQAVPISVYEAGLCYSKLENREKAVEYFRRFVYTCPIHELFPYGVYHLLDLEIAMGNAAKALEDYEALRPVRLEDSSGVLHKDFARALEALHKASGERKPDILRDLTAELDAFGAQYPGSAAAPGIALLKGRLIYVYLDKTEGARILNEVRQRYRGEKNITGEVEKILHGG
jgi:tetratricopeptide (TPR) repeat protein